jgi:hypothetical protein
MHATNSGKRDHVYHAGYDAECGLIQSPTIDASWRNDANWATAGRRVVVQARCHLRWPRF